MTHKLGPKGHIVDAFISHLKTITPAPWVAACDAVWDAACDAAGAAARDAAWDAAGAAARDAAWDAAGAANEIQGADLLRERGQSFYFLPLFGFADENAVPIICTTSVPIGSK